LIRRGASGSLVAIVTLKGWPNMELLSNLSDDQMALLGCATALVCTGTLMSLSYFVGRGRMQGAQSTSQSPVLAEVVQTVAADAVQPSKHRSAA
jgi:hypothetical protein